MPKNWKPWSVVLGIGLFCFVGCKDDKGSQADDTDGMGDGDGDGDTNPSTEKPPELPRIVSGSRLKQVWWQAGDAALPQGIRDTDLDVGCIFDLAEDDVLRCLPHGGPVVFTDDQCTQAVILYYPSTECEDSRPPVYGGLYTRPSSCEEKQKRLLWVAGDAVEAPTTLYQLEAGGCVEREVDAATLLAATPADVETFVRGERVVDERTEEVGVAFIHSEDGAWFPQELLALGTGRACVVVSQTHDDETSHHCVSGLALSGLSGVSGFADDACLEPAAVHFNACSAPEVVSSLEGSAGCPVRVLRELGEEISTSYVGSAGSCEELDPTDRPSDTYFRVGDLATGLIDLQLGELKSGTRLQDRYWYLDGVPLFRLHSAYDTELERECSVYFFEGGKLACLPSPILNIGHGSSTVYKDPECTQVIVPGSSAPCNEGDYAYILMQGDDVCTGANAELYAAGASHSSDTVYNLTGETCSPSATSPDTIWYERLEELVLEDTFVTFTEVMDD